MMMTDREAEMVRHYSSDGMQKRAPAERAPLIISMTVSGLCVNCVCVRMCVCTCTQH